MIHLTAIQSLFEVNILFQVLTPTSVHVLHMLQKDMNGQFRLRRSNI